MAGLLGNSFASGGALTAYPGLTGIPGEALGMVYNGQMLSPGASLSSAPGLSLGNSASAPTFGGSSWGQMAAGSGLSAPPAAAAPTLGASSALSTGQSGDINWQQLINSLMQKMGATTGGSYSAMGFGGQSGMYGG